MRIALDYDDTYTLDPEFWDNFIELSLTCRIDIRIVTVRHPELDKVRENFTIPVIYTTGMAKRWWLENNLDWMPDIWIDDTPMNIEYNSTKNAAWLANWRATREY